MSSPTFGTGLIVGGAYFYAQTEAQKKSQPASLTAAAGGYTTNDSYFVGIAQQNYWDENKWRFGGVAGYVDFKFTLQDPQAGGTAGVDWDVYGSLAQADLARRISGHWYAGVLARYLDMSQRFSRAVNSQDYDTSSDISSTGGGVTVDFDTRDVPTNPYRGSYLQGKAIVSSVSGGRGSSYESYYLRYRNYHSFNRRLVLATEISGCTKAGIFPLWDTCRLNLRGFPVTDYLGKSSLIAQAAGRWHLTPRWGVVAFVGGGVISNSFSDQSKKQIVPSYGVGVRFMVLESKRINLRVDYARSTDSDAWYVAVGEAF